MRFVRRNIPLQVAVVVGAAILAPLRIEPVLLLESGQELAQTRGRQIYLWTRRLPVV